MPQKTVYFTFASGATQSWTADVDYLFTCLSATATVANVAYLTKSASGTVTGTSPFPDFLMARVLNSTQLTTANSPTTSLPVLAGESIYCVSSAASSVVIYLDTIPAE